MAGYSAYEIDNSEVVSMVLARRRYPRPSNSQLASTLSSSNSIGFLIARNPYERLISAYRDKIIGAWRDSWHDKMSKTIVVKYRHIPPQSYLFGVTVPTFKEFISYIIDEYRSGKAPDMHWAPVFSFCNPCQVKLTHIIKFETFDRDTAGLLDILDLKHLLPSTGKLDLNKSKDSNHSSSAFVEKYLQELTPDQLKSLQEIYGADFEILGYDKRENFQFRRNPTPHI